MRTLFFRNIPADISKRLYQFEVTVLRRANCALLRMDGAATLSGETVELPMKGHYPVERLHCD